MCVCFHLIQVYRKTKDKEAAVLAASRAASNVKDAADAVALSRSDLLPLFVMTSSMIIY